MRAQAHMGERTHNPIPPMESHTRMERGKKTDKQQRITNHIALPSTQVSSIIGNVVFNIDAPANGAIRLNKCMLDFSFPGNIQKQFAEIKS